MHPVTLIPTVAFKNPCLKAIGKFIVISDGSYHLMVSW